MSSKKPEPETPSEPDLGFEHEPLLLDSPGFELDLEPKDYLITESDKEAAYAGLDAAEREAPFILADVQSSLLEYGYGEALPPSDRSDTDGAAQPRTFVRNTGNHKAADVAKWMLDEMKRLGGLSHWLAVDEIRARFGTEFIEDSDEGHGSIVEEVRRIFREGPPVPVWIADNKEWIPKK